MKCAINKVILSILNGNVTHSYNSCVLMLQVILSTYMLTLTLTHFCLEFVQTILTAGINAQSEQENKHETVKYQIFCVSVCLFTLKPTMCFGAA